MTQSNKNLKPNKSLKRLWRQLVFVPWWHNRWLDKTAKATLNDYIYHAELGHDGEIVLIIENHLPLQQAYDTDCHTRAIDLFAIHRIWDTKDNTGVLIYLNLCEHNLQIIADRGIHQKVHDSYWQACCQSALEQFKQGQFVDGLCQLITTIGQSLNLHYPSDTDTVNQLSNHPIHLK